MSVSLDTVVSGDKSEYANKRHLLVCDNCCWCLSYLPDLERDEIEYFDNCPYCNEETNPCLFQRRLQKIWIQNIFRTS